MGSGEGLLTEAQVAQFLKVRPVTLAAWRLHKRGPRYIAISHSCVRYQIEDLKDFIESRAIIPGCAKSIEPEYGLRSEIQTPEATTMTPPP